MSHTETSHDVHVGTEVQTLTTAMVRIGCDDALLVRADHLVLDQSEGHLKAIVDGIISHLGPVSPEVIARLIRHPHAIVEAPHFHGGHVVRRKVPVHVR